MRCALSVIEAAGSPLARPVGGAGFSRPSAASGLVSRPGAPCASTAGTIAHAPGRGIEALSAGSPARAPSRDRRARGTRVGASPQPARVHVP